MLVGRLEDARAILEGVSATGNPLGRSRILSVTAHIDVLQGEWDAARDAVEEFYRVLPEHSSAPVQFIGMRVLQVDLALATGHLEEAAERALHLLSEERPWMRRWIWLSHLLVPPATVVERLRRASRTDPSCAEAAEAVASALWDLIGLVERDSDRVHRPIEEVTVPMARALIAEDAGEAFAQWSVAVVGARRFSARIDLVRSLIGLGASAAVLGDRDTARRSLVEARELAEECAAGALVRDAVDAAEAAGIELPHVEEEVALPSESAAIDRSALGGLTPREAEVLGLIAGGRTNREIAGELMISVKTVSVHVSNVLAKLGVSNRNAAAVRAREAGME